MENVPRDLLDFSDNEDGQELDKPSDSVEEIDNPLHSYSFNSLETIFIPHINIRGGQYSSRRRKRTSIYI